MKCIQLYDNSTVSDQVLSMVTVNVRKRKNSKSIQEDSIKKAKFDKIDSTILKLYSSLLFASVYTILNLNKHAKSARLFCVTFSILKVKTINR